MLQAAATAKLRQGRYAMRTNELRYQLQLHEMEERISRRPPLFLRDSPHPAAAPTNLAAAWEDDDEEAWLARILRDARV
jgi:hypothetical protein